MSMERRGFLGLLLALPFVRKLHPRQRAIDLPMSHTGVGRYEAALPPGIVGNPRFYPGMTVRVASMPAQGVLTFEISQDGKSWSRYG
jgi:hypothetical protein